MKYVHCKIMLDKNSIIWFNGKLIKAGEAEVGIFTHGLHYGTAIFEGCRAYNGKVFKMHEHNERLIKSGELIDVPVQYSIMELNNAMDEVIKANNFKDAYIRPLAFRGDENLGILSANNSTHVAIMGWEMGNYFGEEKINTGLKLQATKYVRPDPRSTETQAKASGLYFIGSIMKNKASKDGYDDVLMLDWQGYVAECSSCNIFFTKGDEIHTPTPNCFLNGITRQTVMKIAQGLGYKVIERKILPQELCNFDGAFVTGTAVEIMPVDSIFDIHRFPNKTIGLRIREEYLMIVR